VGTLPWLQARRSSHLELAGNTGLLHKLEEAKSQLKRYSRIDALLVNRATATQQVVFEVVAEGKSRGPVKSGDKPSTESFRPGG
jgi:hypothetical protein